MSVKNVTHHLLFLPQLERHLQIHRSTGFKPGHTCIFQTTTQKFPSISIDKLIHI